MTVLSRLRGSALLSAQPVKIDDNDDEDTGDNALPKRVHVQQVGAVIDCGQDKGTEQRAVHRADGAKKACATYDRRSYRL